MMRWTRVKTLKKQQNMPDIKDINVIDFIIVYTSRFLEMCLISEIYILTQ